MTENDKNTAIEERIGDQPVGSDYPQDLLEFLETEFAKPETKLRKFLSNVVPLWGLVKGLNITLAATIRGKKVTVKYPEEKIPVANGFRGKHELLESPTGEQLCICCNQCVAICPIDCIELKSQKSESETRKRDLLEYNVDLTKCLFCRLCQEVCPEFCVILGKNYEYSDTERGPGLLKVKMADILRKCTDDEFKEINEKKAAKERAKLMAKPTAKPTPPVEKPVVKPVDKAESVEKETEKKDTEEKPGEEPEEKS